MNKSTNKSTNDSSEKNPNEKKRELLTSKKSIKTGKELLKD